MRLRAAFLCPSGRKTGCLIGSLHLFCFSIPPQGLKLDTDATVIIGAGQAAARCAVEMRRLGYEGTISMFGAEHLAPYQRPELSKSFLARSAAEDEVNVLSAEQAAELKIALCLDSTVENVDVASRVLAVGGENIAFDKLVFATGGSPRRVNGALSLRTLDDAKKLHDVLQREKTITIFGGGWLGLEVGATARAHGLQVTIYEQQDRLCARSLPADVSQLLLEYHRSNGIDIQLNSPAPEDTDVQGVACACIGIEPNDSIAAAAGIETDRGILVNERQMTSSPNIFAIGDCAREPGSKVMENWAYANVSAERAAHAVCDIAVPVKPDLWLWSKQGDMLVQMRGDYKTADRCIVRSNGDSRAHLYVKDGRLQACVAINDPELFGHSRSVSGANRVLDEQELADPRVPLNKVSALQPANA